MRIKKKSTEGDIEMMNHTSVFYVILGIFEYEKICGHNLPVNMCRVANFRIKFVYNHDIFIRSKLSRKF